MVPFVTADVPIVLHGLSLLVASSISAGSGSPPRARGRLDYSHDSPPASGLTPARTGTSKQSALRPSRSGGSPPRARGHPRPAQTVPSVRGLTPACAGTSRRIWRGPGSAWAHPRVRGDIYDLWVERTSWRGSPPRARGHHRSRRHTGSCGGLTPACAGTSTSVGCGMWRLRAHPRVRGDIWAPGVAWGVWEGSPPRARGHQPLRVLVRQGGGLTPACAGTSNGSSVMSLILRAHPRVRGDIAIWVAASSAVRGSPPRARGHLFPRRNPSQALGLTPACAGTSTGRGCVDRADGGSPPRARGHLHPGGHQLHGGGLTPACAGTSSSVSMIRSRCRAHPRVRGDIGDDPAGCADGPGLTPACAGTSRDVPARRFLGGGSPPRARGHRRITKPSSF